MGVLPRRRDGRGARALNPEVGRVTPGARRRVLLNFRHVLVHEFMSIYYALAGWSGNRERRDERTKRNREKDKAKHEKCEEVLGVDNVYSFVFVSEAIRKGCGLKAEGGAAEGLPELA
ncbi:hypothetical protein EVAR_38155_1 [Eumeta japonica]|uniref:Uncharacterized protein n=1 Tax=Eumeta variegata TaxID=151549 RepID=A0A4C1ZL77_EUMVA|nr:hypothetical protein EVAR_38155_1 [Eumeta japonica]